MAFLIQNGFPLLQIHALLVHGFIQLKYFNASTDTNILSCLSNIRSNTVENDGHGCYRNTSTVLCGAECSGTP